MVASIVRTLRPQQWVKNLFVAAPLVFAKHLFDYDFALRAVVAVLAFCALSAAVYSFNDVRDVELDRAHPTKRNRPIASGKLSTQFALGMSAVLAALGLASGAFLGWQFALAAAAYLANNLLYTLGGKRIPFLDVAMIAFGFVIRVYAGGFAIAVPVSGWIVLCTAVLALFLGFGKRAHELAWATSAAEQATTRHALRGYSLTLLRPLLVVLGAAAAATYLGYTLATSTRIFFGTDNLVYTVPFPALGLARFVDLALWHVKESSPTDAMLRDPICIASALGWMAAVFVVLY